MLKTGKLCDLRIISAPVDIPSQENRHIHLELFKHYQFPVGFITERLRSVGHSFGSCTRETRQCKLKNRSTNSFSSRQESAIRLGEKDANLREDFWFHFLCKNITLDANRQLKIQNPVSISSPARHKYSLLETPMHALRVVNALRITVITNCQAEYQSKY